VDLYTFISQPRPSQKPDLQLAVRLQGAHGDELVRDVWFHDQWSFILTCGEDGKVRVWEEAQQQAKPGKVSRKERRKGDGSDVRFKPY